jgi:hypothetical protein
VPQGYGVPYSVLSQAPTLLIQITCEGTKATVTAGSGSEFEYVYQYGYDWRGAWQQISFSGNKKEGPWLIGSASATLTRSAADMAQNNFMVAYVCTWTGSEWKCGCNNRACAEPSWQLQIFKHEQQVSSGGLFKGHSGELMVAYLSKHYGPAGTQLTLSGDGFPSSGNTIHFGDRRIQDRPSPSGSAISFSVPNVPVGRYEVTVQNNKGTAEPGTVFWVTKPGATPPSITSISPTSGGPNTEVTIRGTGFTPTGNEVILSTGNVQNVSSADGKTLRVRIKGFEGGTFKNELGHPLHPSFPVWVYVANTSGVSAQSKGFTLTY